MRNDPLFRESVSLKEYCTMGIGGPARYFYEVISIEAMQNAIKRCRTGNIPYMILGKGSNCLFDDKGFDGAVLLNKIDFLEEAGRGIFYAGAGYSFALLGVQTARKGWSGLEFASGIPATVGGAIYMNAGANGQETSHTLHSVDYIDEEGNLQRLEKNELSFAYRHSSFQTRKGAIAAATFALTRSDDARQKQIAIVNYRIKTQPYSNKSAGCIFANPSNSHAGALIDQCGLKNLSVGGAKVSAVHANFFVNEKDASCRDMLTLIDLVRAKVKEKTGIELQNEIRVISYEG